MSRVLIDADTNAERIVAADEWKNLRAGSREFAAIEELNFLRREINLDDALAEEIRAEQAVDPRATSFAH